MSVELLERTSAHFDTKSPALPIDFHRSSRLTEVMEQAPKNRLTPMWEFRQKGTHIRSLKPIGIRGYNDGEFVFLENETLRLFAHGTTFQEALMNLVLHTIQFYYHYKTTPANKLTKEAQELKRLYGRLFVEES